MIEANEKDPLNVSNRKLSPSKIPGQTKNEKRSSILYSSMSMHTMHPSSYNLQNRQFGGEEYSSICASFDDLVTFEHSSKALINCFIAFFVSIVFHEMISNNIVILLALDWIMILFKTTWYWFLSYNNKLNNYKLWRSTLL